MKKTFLSILLSLSSFLLISQTNLFYYLPQDVEYNEKIPTPKQFLGYEVGEWHVSHDQLNYYMRALAKASDRVEIEEMGASHEGRALFLLRITSVENQKNIEEIKSQHLALSQPARSAQMKTDQMPVVVWLGYTIHGDEASGSNAAMLFAYYLAAARSGVLDQLLSESIILIDPCMNPDGMNRFASWVNTHKGENLITDPASREFSQAWPGGRTNHYWFDLNRDWLPGQHPESQARLKKYHEWKPNLLTDHHEMGSDRSFFFQPGIPSRNNPLTPAAVYKLTNELAIYHAQALNRIGSMYYSGESYDDYYIGKGATYPDLQGGVGILFEQAGVKGHARETENGILRFPFAIRNQVTVSLSTIEGSHALRKDLLQQQKDFFQSALKEAEASPVKAYLVDFQQDAYRGREFWKILQSHQINSYQLAKDVQLAGKKFLAGKSLLIPVAQAQYRYLTAIFERRTAFEDSLFYDVSSWTLPLAFGLEDARLDSKSWKTDLQGEQITTFPSTPSSIIGGQSKYAYAFRWDHYLAPRLLHGLLQQGLMCKVSMLPLETADGTLFDRGSIFIPVASQEIDAETLLSQIEALATESGINIYAISTGFTPKGIDLGSPDMRPLSLPKVALLVDGGVRSYEAGEVWHLLDKRYNIPLSLLDINQLSQTRLSRYTSLVMADGNYNSLTEGDKQQIRSWIEAGGSLICWKGGAQWAARAGLAEWSFAQGGAKEVNDFPFEEKDRLRGAQRIGGAIFSAHIDASHPLGFGYPNGKISLFRNSSLFMQSSGQKVRYPLQYDTEPLQAGYISAQNLKLLAESAGAGVQTVKDGRVIGLSDNPNFRAYWFGTNKLFANALFFSHLMD